MHAQHTTDIRFHLFQQHTVMGLFWGFGDSQSISGTLKSLVNKKFDWRHKLRFCEHAYATPKFHNFTVAAKCACGFMSGTRYAYCERK